MKIPAGINEGMRIRSAGNGEPGTNGGPSGDLYIEIRVKQHDIFERDGDDLHCTVPVGLTTAALGGTIEVPTLGGKAEIDLPEGTQHGKTFRLRGKGIKGIRSSYPGDLYCHVTVETPVKLTEHQRKLLKELDESLPQRRRPPFAQREELDRPREGPVQVAGQNRLACRRPVAGLNATAGRARCARGSGRGVRRPCRSAGAAVRPTRPAPVMRVPKRASLSRPPRISRTRAMTRAARSGKCCSSHCWNSGFTSQGRRSTMLKARLAPAAAAASRMRSSSGSLRKGITGDTLTPTGTPACASVSMAAQPPLRRGGARLHHACEGRVERGDRDVDRRQAVGSHRRDQVEVALDQRRLGDQRKRHAGARPAPRSPNA